MIVPACLIVALLKCSPFPLIIFQLPATATTTAATAIALVLNYCWLIFIFTPFSQAVVFCKFEYFPNSLALSLS